MNVKEVTRREIEAKLSTIGDYVKMDYLQTCLKKSLDFDTRKFVLTRLSATYESRKMFLEAAKLMRSAADINATHESKMNDFVKSSELFIKAGDYQEADNTLTKALASATSSQKIAIKIRMKDSYKAQAKELLTKDKRKHAMDAYEKLLTQDLDPLEKKEAQKSLLYLYEKLGKIQSFYALQKVM